MCPPPPAQPSPNLSYLVSLNPLSAFQKFFLIKSPTAAYDIPLSAKSLRHTRVIARMHVCTHTRTRTHTLHILCAAELACGQQVSCPPEVTTCLQHHLLSQDKMVCSGCEARYAVTPTSQQRAWPTLANHGQLCANVDARMLLEKRSNTWSHVPSAKDRKSQQRHEQIFRCSFRSPQETQQTLCSGLTYPRVCR
jgi:hypothetical protein